MAWLAKYWAKFCDMDKWRMGNLVYFQPNLQTFLGKTKFNKSLQYLRKKFFFYSATWPQFWCLPGCKILFIMCRSSAKIVENVIKLTLVNIYLHLPNMTGLDKHNVMTLINVPIITHLNAVVNQTERAMLDRKSSHYVHNLLTIYAYSFVTWNKSFVITLYLRLLLWKR